MIKKEIKRSRGRPAGSSSFVRIRLGDLNFLGKDATIVVGKKWLNSMGLEAEVVDTKLVSNAEPIPKIEYNLTD